MQRPPGDGVKVRFETTLGNFTVQMQAVHAPKTVANFLQYVDDHYYDNLTFHRVAPEFLVQGGGYEADYRTRHHERPPIPLEATSAQHNVQWSLAMQRRGANTATSEFFINLADNPPLDSVGPGTGFAVFGKVVDGFGTITAMTRVEPGPSISAGGFYPKVPIVILHAYRA
jgi:cyclophilin family peptidyl-prolyl cis-trans isomerase